MTTLTAPNRAPAPRRRSVTCAYRYHRLVGRSETGTPRIEQARDTSGITLTEKTVADLHGRVLTGVATGEGSQRFTPVALAMPTEMNIEFDISWQAKAWSYVVGDNR